MKALQPIRLFVYLVCCIVLVCCKATVEDPEFEHPPIEYPELNVRVIAHRGYWNVAGSAQNSIRALELAGALGIYGSEFDVHLTADNIPVINHDEIIENIPIQTTNYEDIKDCLLPNGEKLPTLENYLQKGKELENIKMILEIKKHANEARDREAVRIIAQMVENMHMEDRVEYITFSLFAGLELVKILPDSKVSYLSGDLTPLQVKNYGFTGINYHYLVMMLHPGYFTEAKNLGLSINIWTVNDISLAVNMINRGCDFITTDNPTEIKGYMRSFYNTLYFNR
jgi:glycerophosphoryl diester phosphodiesterase